VQRLLLDEACLNVSAHHSFRDSSYYTFDQKSLAQHMLYQLTQDLDVCKPLRRQKQGACGALFKLTLESHRYTFVTKGTVVVFKSKLKHKGLVYCHLDKA
jgi:hypothetical protein